MLWFHVGFGKSVARLRVEISSAEHITLRKLSPKLEIPAGDMPWTLNPKAFLGARDIAVRRSPMLGQRRKGPAKKTETLKPNP